jgi:pimeloyl-ACP methyl ester carboxylesterase
MRVIYLPGMAGDLGVSPALKSLDLDIVIPAVPGFDGDFDFVSPTDHLEWLSRVWDALDDTGALPCPVIGASVGGMLAADLAVFRPEVVTKLILISPVGIFDERHPGEDYFGVAPANRSPLLFAGEVPSVATDLFAEHPEPPVAREVSSAAVASMVWPLGDRGLRHRNHRIRADTLLIWGEQDRIVPIESAELWPRTSFAAIAGAGHLAEWDQPEAVAGAIRDFLE